MLFRSIGLIAFAGGSFLQCPLTLDYGAFAISMDAVDTTIIPQGGTSLSGAIRTAIDAFENKEKKHKAIILITDGESHVGDPIKAAEEAAEQGIKIFCVGVGSKSGDLIPIDGRKGRSEERRVGQECRSRWSP